ncbi:hypothetical protein HMPREF3039_00306 [Akkermansia sp. KLE1798]|nr:hypothetical protein HMPREF3039_00306 [Akkermansia sp. KLE1798]
MNLNHVFQITTFFSITESLIYKRLQKTGKESCYFTILQQS